MRNRSVVIAALLALTAASDRWDGAAVAQATEYRKTTVGAILKGGARSDGQRVELHGRLISGNEVSIVLDDSTCKVIGATGCSLWADFGKCGMVDGEPTTPTQCVRSVRDRSSPRQPDNGATGLFELANVTIRGVVFTVRRDVTYGESVPKAFRLGFGHLSAYPGEIDVVWLRVGG
jgi:hypothetical protein